MAFRIPHNVEAMNAHRWLSNAQFHLNKSLERLSSGYRINRAADDAAGLAIANQFRMQTRSLNQALNNTSQAINLIHVAEGAANQINAMLDRLKELATEAASDTVDDTRRQTIQNEVDQILSEIDKIRDATQYAGMHLFSGSFPGTDQVASNENGEGVHNAGNVINHWDAATIVAAGTVTLTVETASGQMFTITSSSGVTIAEDENARKITIKAGNQTFEFNEDINVTLDIANSASVITLNGITGSNPEGITSGTIAGDTKFELKLGDSGGFFTFQVGFEESDSNLITLQIGDVTTGALGIHNLDVNDIQNAQKALTSIDNALSVINGILGDLGATENKLLFQSHQVQVMVENYTASEATIRDVDMAAEMAEFTKNQILVQTSMAMLAQANAVPQNIVSLLR